MSKPPQATLGQLHAKQRRLQQLQEESARLTGFIRELRRQEAALQQLNTSAREAQSRRFTQQTGLTISEQIEKYENDYEELTDEMNEVRDAITELSYLQIQSASS